MRMLFPFIFTICFLFYSKVKRSTITHEEELSAFLEREHKANSTRKKNIDNLNYITLELETLPFLDNPSKNISNYENDIKKLAPKKILKLTGISNTELKMTYGVANLPALTEYDENFMRLSTILSKWGGALLEEGYTTEAQTVLELALSYGCDASSIYTNLATIYVQQGIGNIKIPAMIKQLKSSKNLLKNSIINKLKAILDSAKS